jgi:hypothetical protein
VTVSSRSRKIDEIDISPILVEHLRQDTSGSMIKEMSDLAYHAFREPPWNDDLEAPRLHFGLGVDLMRRNAKAWIAWSKPARKVVGYILGYEAFLQPRLNSCGECDRPPTTAYRIGNT